jgi:hypothetical protein
MDASVYLTRSWNGAKSVHITLAHWQLVQACSIGVLLSPGVTTDAVYLEKAV